MRCGVVRCNVEAVRRGVQYLYQQASARAVRARRQPRLKLGRRGAFLPATFVYIFSYFDACLFIVVGTFFYHFDYIHTYVYCLFRSLFVFFFLHA